MPRTQRAYTVREAAKDLGIERGAIERMLRTGNTMFGFCVPVDSASRRYSYYVYRERVEAYISAQDLKCPLLNSRVKGESLDIENLREEGN